MGKYHEIEIGVGGRKVGVYEQEEVCDPESGRAYTGAWVWNSSFVLAHWMVMADSTFLSFKGKRVVELGAGTGIPGLVAASIGAHEVLLTDIPPLVTGLQRNVEENGLSDRVKVMPLVWGEDEDDCCKELSSPPADFVLMSDLLYDVTAMPALCHTLKHLINNNTTQVLMSCELRFGTFECLEEMVERGFVLSMVPQCQLHPDWQGQDYVIYIATLAERAETYEPTL